jgi:molybdenum cofactor cytidylyltransferase
MNDNDRIPIIDPTDLDTTEHTDTEHTERTIGGIVLAAGMGTRYDAGNKLLEAIDGEPIVHRAVRTFLDATIDSVVVVIGHETDAIRSALDGLDSSIVVNTEYEAGQSTSMHHGVEVARKRDWDGIVFGLGDMPFVRPKSVDLLVRAERATEHTILVAAYERKRGNPTLFDAVHYDALTQIEGDTGGRPLIVGSDETALVETDDPGVVRDIDTVEDYEYYQ